MKYVNIILTCSLSFTLAACAPGKEVPKAPSQVGVDSYTGGCDQGYAAAYNKAAFAIDWLSVALTMENEEAILKQGAEVQAACKEFLPKYDGVSCKGEVNGEVKMVHSEDIKKLCESVEEMLTKEKAL